MKSQSTMPHRPFNMHDETAWLQSQPTSLKHSRGDACKDEDHTKILHQDVFEEAK